MFSGIVEATAEVLEIKGPQLVISRPNSYTDTVIGASIAVSGVCLSVTEFDDESLKFDVVQETFDKSTLGSLQVGDSVNVERSIQADARLDGHVVQGHVEGVGKVEMRNEKGEMTLVVPKELNKFFIQKGSIAIDGVSLTIAKIDQDQITVALVPHTLEKTTLGSLNAGDKVNIETDIIGRYVYAFSHEEATHQK